MDIATAEFFRKEREQCTTRDAKHVMPIKLIPDLEWEFIENISVMESDKGVTIYYIKETEDRNENTQVTEASEPKIDTKTTENIEPVITEAGEAPGVTQTSGGSNVTEIAAPRYEHRESSEIATENAVPREMTEETELTGSTGISQAILVDPARDNEATELSEQAVAEEIELADTIEVTEIDIDIPQKENPEVQNNSEDTSEIDAEQVSKKTHKYPKANNSLVNKIFSVFRQAKESLVTIPL